MELVRRGTAKILCGLLSGAACAIPQPAASGQPAVVSYSEGSASIAGREYSASELRNTVLFVNQVLSTGAGKAEIQVLLAPGVFLRIGDHTTIRMTAPSPTVTQFEITSGEAMLEASELRKDHPIEVATHGAVIRIEKTGLYRIDADSPAALSVYDGEAKVQIGATSQQIKKGHELLLANDAKPQKLEKKSPDPLYAWSKVRSKEEGASRNASARPAPDSSNDHGFGDVNTLPGFQRRPLDHP